MGDIKVFFLGSKPIGEACLKHLLTLSKVKIVGIITKSHKAFDSNIIRIAKENDIRLFNHLDELSDLSIDYLISIQFHEILTEDHIAYADKLAINLHMAPLPEYRGCNQFSYAIVEGADEFGSTLHKLDASIDGGDIIAERRFPIHEDIWVEELYNKTFEASLDLFKSEIGKILEGKFVLIKQSSLTDRKSSIHYRNEINDLKRLDMNWSKDKINRHIRATLMPGFDPPYTIEKGKKIEFREELE